MDRIEPRQIPEAIELEQGAGISTNEANIRSIQGYFDVESPTTDEHKILSEIYRLTTGDGAVEMHQVLLFLRDIEHRLGATPLGERRINRVYNYLKVMDSMRDLEKEKALYER
jgi:hypothetical protein